MVKGDGQRHVPVLDSLHRLCLGRVVRIAETAGQLRRHRGVPRAPKLPLLPRSQVLEGQESLLFHLQRQQLIELIRQGNVEGALEFAQEFLAAKCEENPENLAELGTRRRMEDLEGA